MPILPEFKNRFMDFVDEQEQKHTLIAEKIGVPYDVFSKIKNYGIVPTPRTLIKIADYFETSVDYLLGRTNVDFFIPQPKKDTFHNRLNSLKSAKNLTFYALGKRLHISSNYFSDWKAKNYLPSLDHLIIIADFFNTSLDYLLGRSEE